MNKQIMANFILPIGTNKTPTGVKLSGGVQLKSNLIRHWH